MGTLPAEDEATLMLAMRVALPIVQRLIATPHRQASRVDILPK
jgi:hypothetical protein